MELSQVEQDIVAILRELKPHERLEVIKDQSGKPNCYVVHRSQKILLVDK